MPNPWDQDIAGLLTELSSTQDDLLTLLREKRELLMRGDTEALAAMAVREQSLIDRLQQCQSQRTDVLTRAKDAGLPSDSIASLATALPRGEKQTTEPTLSKEIAESNAKMRLVQHQSLANWVLVQRSLVHLSQLLEIIATGGRAQPTYGKGESVGSSGTLVDHAA